MSREDVIRLALEAGFKKDNCGVYQPDRLNPEADCGPELAAFTNLVIEECAKVCDDQAEYADEHLTDSAWRSADRCAAAIRARKSK